MRNINSFTNVITSLYLVRDDNLNKAQITKQFVTSIIPFVMQMFVGIIELCSSSSTRWYFKMYCLLLNVCFEALSQVSQNSVFCTNKSKACSTNIINSKRKIAIQKNYFVDFICIGEKMVFINTLYNKLVVMCTFLC